MRLLKIAEDGTLSLVEKIGHDIPKYAVLSHTWGLDQDEVSFEDFKNGKGQDRPGYDKIRQCALQAARDHLSYVWVDTCCIDKTSSAELSEAINSMWQWYRDSEICYVLLSDVCLDRDHAHRLGLSGQWVSMAEARWFTRGWTLQELIAPGQLQFFDACWKSIGSRHDLAEEVSTITKIQTQYLSGNVKLLRHASTARKMSWASGRKTKRVEDIAYSLLGMFDINMPLLYGEGTRAFQRLQEHIIQQSDDLSIFAWGPSEDSFPAGTISRHAEPLVYLPMYSIFRVGFLAQSPASFSASGNIIRTYDVAQVEPFYVANKRLHIKFEVLSIEPNMYARLNCRYEDDFLTDLGIPLSSPFTTFFELPDMRLGHGPRAISLIDWSYARPRSMNLDLTWSADSVNPTEDEPEEFTCFIRNSPTGYTISEVYPPLPCSRNHRSITHRIDRTSQSSVASSLFVVAVTTVSQQPLLFVLFYRKNKLFVDWTLDGRILPSNRFCEFDRQGLKHVYDEWRNRNLSTLPYTQTTKDGCLSIRVIPQTIRGKCMSTITVTKHIRSQAWTVELDEQAYWTAKSLGHRIWNLFDRNFHSILVNKRSSNLFKLFYLVVIVIIPVAIPMQATSFSRPVLPNAWKLSPWFVALQLAFIIRYYIRYKKDRARPNFVMYSMPATGCLDREVLAGTAFIVFLMCGIIWTFFWFYPCITLCGLCLMLVGILLLNYQQLYT
ncbi:hypothetical protein ACN47E_008011 [Coniothyrium glycines]